MDREQLEKYILNTYRAKSDFPWTRYPAYEVFRHTSNKWFAVIMEITKDKLGLDTNQNIQVVNLKCDPLLICSLIEEKGIFPAYHMNKKRWISVILDDDVDDDKLKMLVDVSYHLTKTK